MSGDGAQAIRRVIGLLDELAAAPVSMPVPTIAATVGLPASTAYRMVAVLERAGLVQRLPDGTVGVGVKTLDLAHAARRHSDTGILWAARPTMRWLSQETQETLILMMPAGRSAVCVDQILCRYPIRTSYEPGRSMPLYAGAANKVILAFIEDGLRNAIVAESDGLQLPTGERVSSGTLARELSYVREVGYCTSEGEIDQGTWGVAFPIRHGRRVIASLTVAGPTVRLKPQAPSLVRQLHRAAREISEAWN